MTSETRVDCGPVSVDFFNESAGLTPLDSSMFLDDRTAPGSFNLAVISTADLLKTGVYPIRYAAYYSNYPTNVAPLADTFTI